jgi:hypothetical protein
MMATRCWRATSTRSWKQTGSGGKIDKLAGRKIDAATAAIMAVWRAQLAEPEGEVWAAS